MKGHSEHPLNIFLVPKYLSWIEIELFQSLDEAYEASARARARIWALEYELEQINKNAMATETLCSYLGRFSDL